MNSNKTNPITVLKSAWHFENNLKDITWLQQISVDNYLHLTTLNLGYKSHENLAELDLTLILLTILTSFDPKPYPYF